MANAKLTKEQRRNGFTLVELLVVIAIIGILVALLLPAVQAARESARRSSCVNNVKNLSLAMHNYHDTYGQFPAAMEFPNDKNWNPLRDTALFKNWTIAILPFIEEQPLFNQFEINETTRVRDPGTNGTNALARATEVKVLLCPSDSENRNPFQGSGGTWARGNYGLNAMHYYPNAFWRDLKQSTSDDPSLADFGFQIGISGLSDGKTDQSLSMAQITDGTSKTIMLSEMRAGIDATDRRGVWAMGMCGSSFHCRHLDAPPNGCEPGHDDLFGAADLIALVGETTLNQRCMGVQSGLDASGQSTVRSQHIGGVNVGMADGSVRFVTDFVETGDFVLSGAILAEQTQGDNFLTWQRLNVARDSYTVGEY